MSTINELEHAKQELAEMCEEFRALDGMQDEVCGPTDNLRCIKEAPTGLFRVRLDDSDEMHGRITSHIAGVSKCATEPIFNLKTRKPQPSPWNHQKPGRIMDRIVQELLYKGSNDPFEKMIMLNASSQTWTPDRIVERILDENPLEDPYRNRFSQNLNDSFLKMACRGKEEQNASNTEHIPSDKQNCLEPLEDQFKCLKKQLDYVPETLGTPGNPPNFQKLLPEITPETIATGCSYKISNYPKDQIACGECLSNVLVRPPDHVPFYETCCSGEGQHIEQILRRYGPTYGQHSEHSPTYSPYSIQPPSFPVIDSFDCFKPEMIHGCGRHGGCKQKHMFSEKSESTQMIKLPATEVNLNSDLNTIEQAFESIHHAVKGEITEQKYNDNEVNEAAIAQLFFKKFLNRNSNSEQTSEAAIAQLFLNKFLNGNSEVEQRSGSSTALSLVHSDVEEQEHQGEYEDSITVDADEAETSIDSDRSRYRRHDRRKCRRSRRPQVPRRQESPKRRRGRSRSVTSTISEAQDEDMEAIRQMLSSTVAEVRSLTTKLNEVSQSRDGVEKELTEISTMDTIPRDDPDDEFLPDCKGKSINHCLSDMEKEIKRLAARSLIASPIDPNVPSILRNLKPIRMSAIKEGTCPLCYQPHATCECNVLNVGYKPKNLLASVIEANPELKAADENQHDEEYHDETDSGHYSIPQTESHLTANMKRAVPQGQSGNVKRAHEEYQYVEEYFSDNENDVHNPTKPIQMFEAVQMENKGTVSHHHGGDHESFSKAENSGEDHKPFSKAENHGGDRKSISQAEKYVPDFSLIEYSNTENHVPKPHPKRDQYPTNPSKITAVNIENHVPKPLRKVVQYPTSPNKKTAVNTEKHVPKPHPKRDQYQSNQTSSNTVSQTIKNQLESPSETDSDLGFRLTSAGPTVAMLPPRVSELIKTNLKRITIFDEDEVEKQVTGKVVIDFKGEKGKNMENCLRDMGEAVKEYAESQMESFPIQSRPKRPIKISTVRGETCPHCHLLLAVCDCNFEYRPKYLLEKPSGNKRDKTSKYKLILKRQHAFMELPEYDSADESSNEDIPSDLEMDTLPMPTEELLAFFGEDDPRPKDALRRAKDYPRREQDDIPGRSKADDSWRSKADDPWRSKADDPRKTKEDPRRAKDDHRREKVVIDYIAEKGKNVGSVLADMEMDIKKYYDKQLDSRPVKISTVPGHKCPRCHLGLSTCGCNVQFQIMNISETPLGDEQWNISTYRLLLQRLGLSADGSTKPDESVNADIPSDLDTLSLTTGEMLKLFTHK